jgi:hypothetical protein
MVSCEGCGGEFDAGVRECPYCGRSVVQRAEDEKRTFEGQERTYGASQDDEGFTHVQFGDGHTGARPSSGGGVSGHYRQGAGSQGNVASERLEEKLDQVNRQLEEVPDPSKHMGSKDVGVALLESISTVGDLMSSYQSSISRESHLSSSDRDRLSKKEEKVKPKLRSMVTFCERVDSKTRKKMGLSEGDVHRIKTSATRALQMMESGKCSRCGAVNGPGAKQCQNCGFSL